MLTQDFVSIEYARFLRRAAAAALDGVLFASVSMLILVVVYGKAYLGWLHEDTSGGFYGWLDPIVNQVLPIIVPALFWVRLGATPGKLLMECCVVDAVTFEKISFSRALLRSFAYLVSLATFGLGFIWVIWDKRGQSFHDKIARTVVVIETDTWARVHQEWNQAGLPS